MFQRVVEEKWRCPEAEPAVHQEGPGGLPEPAGEELPPVHGVLETSDTARGRTRQPSAGSQVREMLSNYYVTNSINKSSRLPSDGYVNSSPLV